MTTAGFCKSAACWICCGCIFLLHTSALAGGMYKKDYVVKLDRGEQIWCEPYVVQKTDSLTRIFQGKGGLIDENPQEFLTIFRHLNPRVQDLENVPEGLQIWIPLKKLGPVQEGVSHIFTLPMVTISAEKTPPKSEARPQTEDADFSQYKIKSGDTLTRIFQQFFGPLDASAFADKLRLFQRQNPDVTDINRLYPGQTLWLPVMDSAEDVSASLVNRTGPLERVSALLHGRLTQKGVYYFPRPDQTDFRLDLSRYPIAAFPGGLRMLFNPGASLTADDETVIRHFWPEVKIVAIPLDVSDDTLLDAILQAEPGLGGQLEKNTRLASLLNSASPASAILADGGHVIVYGNRQLVETLMRILGISYTQNVEMSFPYADVQITSHANWIDAGNGKPVLVDFGSFYGDAARALEKTGFVVIQILDTDSLDTAIPRLLKAVGVTCQVVSEIPINGQPPVQAPVQAPVIWIQRPAHPSLVVTDAALVPTTARAIHENGMILITVKKKPGEK